MARCLSGSPRPTFSFWFFQQVPLATYKTSRWIHWVCLKNRNRPNCPKVISLLHSLYFQGAVLFTSGALIARFGLSSSLTQPTEGSTAVESEFVQETIPAPVFFLWVFGEFLADVPVVAQSVSVSPWWPQKAITFYAWVPSEPTG